MDFRDSTSPEIEQIPFRFAECGHTICAVDSGAGHENLTEEYAAIPTELASVCAFFGKSVLREIRETAFYEHLPALRAAVGIAQFCARCMYLQKTGVWRQKRRHCVPVTSPRFCVWPLLRETRLHCICRTSRRAARYRIRRLR